MINIEEKKDIEVELSDLLFKELSKVLNEIHGLDYSVRFWTMLLQSYVRSVLNRKSIIEKEESFKKPETFAINALGYPGAKDKFLKHVRQFGKHILSRNEKSKIFNSLRNHDTLNIGFPDNKGIKKTELGHGLPIYYNSFFGIGEKKKRVLLYELAQNYENIFLRNCVKEMPKVLVEHFKAAHDEIELFEPEKKQFHVHFESFYMRILLSKYMQSGAKVIWYQHGSELGEIEMQTSHYVQLNYVDEFRTWGWKVNEKEVPWKAYRLKGFESEYENYKDNIREFDFLLCYPHINKSNVKKYVKITNGILYHLDTRYTKILARPRRSHKLYSHASKLKFINDDRVKKSTGLSHMAEDMSKCKLIIQLNVPSTNFLECLYVNHPTIGILNNDRPTDIVKPFYGFFKENGVLHDDMESLVAHLNRIDLDSWWSRLIKEEMYRSFKFTFARETEFTQTDEQ